MKQTKHNMLDRIALVWLLVLPLQACGVTPRQDPSLQPVTDRWLAAVDKPYTPRFGALDDAGINRAVNAIPYRLDDEWKPAITSGDCEDYVIAKYHELRAKGHTHMRMRVVRLRTSGTYHAVLLLRDMNASGGWLVFDNRNPSQKPYPLGGMLPDYQPVYDIDAATGIITIPD